jgi:ABC-type sugar transport system permease subunit
MSTVAPPEAAPAPASVPPPTLDDRFRPRLRFVQAWHLVLALASAYVLANIAAGVWALDSLPRTALGIIGAVGLAANLLVLWPIHRRRHVARAFSFTMLYGAILGAGAVLAEVLGLYEGLDLFAGAFQAAFWQLVIVGVGFAWFVVARRVEKRVAEDGNEGSAAASSAHWLARAGLVVAALGGVWWLIALDIPAGLRFIWDNVAASPTQALVLTLITAGSIVAARFMWSPDAALYFRATAKQSDRMVGWMYLSPNLVGFLAFFAFPLAFSLVISFFDWDGLTSPTFVGGANYWATLQDPLFHQSLTNIFWFMLMAVPLSVISALILAVLIHTNYPGVKLFRAVFFVPSVAGVIGVTLIWKGLFNAQTGTINWSIGRVGEWVNAVLPGDPVPERVEIGWLSDPSVPFGLPQVWWLPSIALITVVIVFAWAQFGFNTVLFSAGLQSISKELYEAAELDGANAWQRFRNVTIPSLRSTTFFVTATTVILCLQLFDIVYALNQPNPVGFPNNATLTPVVYLYQLGFQQNAFGLASAVAWVLFILIFFFTLAQFRRQRAEVEG